MLPHSSADERMGGSTVLAVFVEGISQEEIDRLSLMKDFFENCFKTDSGNPTSPECDPSFALFGPNAYQANQKSQCLYSLILQS